MLMSFDRDQAYVRHLQLINVILLVLDDVARGVQMIIWQLPGTSRSQHSSSCQHELIGGYMPTKGGYLLLTRSHLVITGEAGAMLPAAVSWWDVSVP
jgi:hypothetical protein